MVGIWVHGCVAVWLRVHGVGDVCYTATRTSSASPAHDTTAHKDKEGCNANQTDGYADRTLNSKIRTQSLCSSGWMPLSSRVLINCVGACVIHISESKLGQSISKDPAINGKTDEFSGHLEPGREERGGLCWFAAVGGMKWSERTE